MLLNIYKTLETIWKWDSSMKTIGYNWHGWMQKISLKLILKIGVLILLKK